MSINDEKLAADVAATSKKSPQLVTHTPARGMVTPAALDSWHASTGRALTKAELRLLPFIHHSAANGGKIESSRINDEEIEILCEFQEEGLVHFQRTHGKIGWYDIHLTRKFYDAMNDVLFLTYIASAEERREEE